jgi:hypothetical protein
MPRRPEHDDPVDLVLGALAVHRLTRLVTDDTITEHLREPIVERGGWPGYFTTCPWCVSMWVAGGWLLLRTAAPRTARALGTVLASSSVAGLLASWE